MYFIHNSASKPFDLERWCLGGGGVKDEVFVLQTYTVFLFLHIEMFSATEIFTMIDICSIILDYLI